MAKVKKKWIIIGIIAFFAIGIGGAAIRDIGSETDDTSDSSSEPATSAEVTTEPETTTAEQETSEDSTEAVTEAITEAPTDESKSDEISTDSDEKSYTLLHGELLSTIINNIDGKKVIVVKSKIKPSYNNKATINQNYFNVEDLIKEQGCDSFDEIQYWAVADMTDGSEQKVVSFTVSSSLIKKIADDSVVAIQFGDYVDDLYILPSLQD